MLGLVKVLSKQPFVAELLSLQALEELNSCGATSLISYIATDKTDVSATLKEAFPTTKLQVKVSQAAVVLFVCTERMCSKLACRKQVFLVTVYGGNTVEDEMWGHMQFYSVGQESPLCVNPTCSRHFPMTLIECQLR